MFENARSDISADAEKLKEFKLDVTEMMRYLRDTDLTAEPFDRYLADQIKIGILSQWNRGTDLFSNCDMELLKIKILQAFDDLCHYLDPSYIHALPDGRLIFNNDPAEAGDMPQTEFHLKIQNIRRRMRDLLAELDCMEIPKPQPTCFLTA